MDPLKKFLIKPTTKSSVNQIKLRNSDPGYSGNKSKIDMITELEQFSEKIGDLQYKLFAANSKSLLIILQGVDASGKDGTIRQVMRALNPQNCYVKSFGVPSEAESAHDYLWRIHAEVPSKGQIVIFNRSHYEDIVEPTVNNIISKDQMVLRCRQINEFERYLSLLVFHHCHLGTNILGTPKKAAFTDADEIVFGTYLFSRLSHPRVHKSGIVLILLSPISIQNSSRSLSGRTRRTVF